MALLDRFRPSSPAKHPDPSVRLAYVEELPIEERELLAAVAREDEDARVRRAAVRKLMDASALAEVARDDADEGVRGQAVEMLRNLALEAYEGIGEAESLAAVDALDEPRAFAQVAKSASREEVARRALARVTDARMLGSIARHAALETIRGAAFATLQDHDEIVAVAMNSPFKDTAFAAVERLTDRGDLEAIATRGRNKAAARRARAIVREQDEQATAAALPERPGPEEIARAERMQIVRRLETVVQLDDVGAIEAAVKEAEAAWASGEGSDDPAVAARFTNVSTLAHARIAEERAREAARQRAREALTAGEQVRVELCERIDRLSGPTEPQELARIGDEWRQLEPLSDARAQASLERRFEQAVRACERRHAEWKDAERRRARLGELAAELDGAAADADLASARRRFSVAQREWTDLGAHIAIDDEQAARATAAAARLDARVAEAREQEARACRDALHRVHQLLARVEPMVANPDASLKALERALRDVRASLSDMAPLPSKADSDEVSRRLKAAHAALVPKVQELRETSEWQRWANVGIQEQLCVRMEELRAADDPEEIARRIRDLQQQWRQAADVPRAQGEILWRRFKTAHDEVWARCEAHFSAQAEARAENLVRKTALCERAEGLSDSVRWIQTAEEIKQLQAEWKAIGPVTRGQEKAIWERFRSACDRFFKRRHEDLALRKAVWAENFAKKGALCARAEALAESTDWEAAAAEIKRLQNEWKTIGPVKKNRSEAIWQRFRGACDQFFTRYAQRHDIARAERVAAREAICAELEALSLPDQAAAEPPPDLSAAVRLIRSRWQQELAARGVDRERAVALDRRFAAAFDRAIARWPAAFAGTDLDPEANRRRMESLCHRMEDLAASIGHGAGAADEALSPTTRLAAMLKEALAANTIGGKVDEESRLRAAVEDVHHAQASWARIGPVADDARRALADRFQRACRRILDRQPGRAAAGAGGPTRPGVPTGRAGAPGPGRTGG